MVDYEKKYQGWGETMRKAALSGLKITAAASNVSFPGLSAILTTVVKT